jgi:uncharacterized protein with FMN-binding domain
MKRLILTVTGTAAGVVALLSFKTQTNSVASSGTLPSAGVPGQGTSSAAPASGAASATSTPTPAARSSSSTATSTKSFTGSPVTTRYGIVQVKVTVSGSKITNVAFVQLTAFDQHSQQINSFAAPQLLKETLNAQSAQVNTISGASYTSSGYQQSLQSALDQAGIK